MENIDPKKLSDEETAEVVGGWDGSVTVTGFGGGGNVTVTGFSGW